VGSLPSDDEDGGVLLRECGRQGRPRLAPCSLASSSALRRRLEARRGRDLERGRRSSDDGRGRDSLSH